MSISHDSPRDRFGSGNDPSGDERVQDFKQHAGEAAQQAKQQAKDEGRARAEQVQGQAADRLERVADGARAAAEELAGDDIGHASEYISDVADRISGLSRTLREKSGDELIRDVRRIAREHPALFIGGSVALGLGLARFARASNRHTHDHDAVDTERHSNPYADTARDSAGSRDDGVGDARYGAAATTSPGAQGSATGEPSHAASQTSSFATGGLHGEATAGSTPRSSTTYPFSTSEERGDSSARSQGDLRP
ncbi:hypothetical protein [Coralloluteibacterium stylophorae]|uniref:DUF3618 domain-containing protein n=1 Tax=Coralloluteibacterium stylophorae TaxID=1776034 RepID=A0A8J8AYT5_9GAMM|nr:hypothetical protein [Coralloluteibacterium stylophorae]MBS7458858.1 hypothetical protein [Coralloluteibacterium stylophorae]